MKENRPIFPQLKQEPVTTLHIEEQRLVLTFSRPLDAVTTSGELRPEAEIDTRRATAWQDDARSEKWVWRCGARAETDKNEFSIVSSDRGNP